MSRDPSRASKKTREGDREVRLARNPYILAGIPSPARLPFRRSRARLSKPAETRPLDRNGRMSKDIALDKQRRFVTVGCGPGFREDARSSDRYPPPSRLAPKPFVHLRSILQIDAGRQPAPNRHPAKLFRLPPLYRACQLQAQSVRNECPERPAQFSGPLFCPDQQVIGQVNRGLHTQNHKAIFMVAQRRAFRKVTGLFSQHSLTRTSLAGVITT